MKDYLYTAVVVSVLAVLFLGAVRLALFIADALASAFLGGI